MEEHIDKELRKYGVLTRSQKRDLIDEIRSKFNKTVSDKQIDDLSAMFLKTSIDNSCKPEDYKQAVEFLAPPDVEPNETNKRKRSDSELDTEDIDILLKKLEKLDIKRKRGGGDLPSATPYLYLLLGLAIKDFQKMTQERVEMTQEQLKTTQEQLKTIQERLETIVVRILNISKQVLELFSNKDNCVEKLVKSMVDKRLVSFLKYFVIGSLATDLARVNPIKTIQFMLKILVNLLPFAQKGVGVAIVSTIGYFVYHYVHYYSERISKDIKDKMTTLKGLLDTLEKTSSESVVNDTNESIKTAIEDIKNLFETKELAEDGELMRVIGENMANEQERLKEHIGDYDDTMTMEELKEKIKEKADADSVAAAAEGQTPAAEGQTPAAEAETLPPGPGGAKKRRATKKKKARKTKTRKTRKSRKTRKNKK